MTIINFIIKYADVLAVLLSAIAVLVSCFWSYKSLREAEKAARISEEAVRLSEKAIAESRKQHEENQRLQLMPFFQIKKVVTDKIDYEMSLPSNLVAGEITHSEFLEFKNIGNGTAATIVYEWTSHGSNNHQAGEKDIESMPFNALEHGDKYVVSVDFTVKPEQKYTLKLSFCDLMGLEYTQEFFFTFNDEELETIEPEISKSSGAYLYLTVNTDDAEANG